MHDHVHALPNHFSTQKVTLKVYARGTHTIIDLHSDHYSLYLSYQQKGA